MSGACQIKWWWGELFSPIVFASERQAREWLRFNRREFAESNFVIR